VPDDDLLRFIGEPPSYSAWWSVLGGLLVAAVIVWCAGVYLWTRDGSSRRLPAVAGVQDWLVRQRAVRAVRSVGDRHRSGALTAAQACAELSAVLRNFMSEATGTPAQYMYVSQIADSTVPLVAGSAPLVDELTAAQFDPAARPDVAGLQRRAEDMIAEWR